MASIIPSFPAEQLSKKGPALFKTVESWFFSLSAYACSMQGGLTAPQPSIWISGQKAAADAGCLICWAETTGTLILSFDGGLSLVLRSLDLHLSKAKLATKQPFYLRESDVSAATAQVVSEYDFALAALLPGIKCAIASLTRKKSPNKVLCTGFCMGGGLATLAAPWAALQWPHADITCVTFGAPIIGNPAFGKMSAWLVGLAYRGIYRMDPVPGMPRPFNKLSIKLCASGEDLYFDGRSPIQHRRPILLHHDLADHSTFAYDQGITAAAATPSPGIPSTPDGRAVLVDPQVAVEVPELAARGDCACAQCHCVAVAGAGLPKTADINVEISSIQSTNTPQTSPKSLSTASPNHVVDHHSTEEVLDFQDLSSQKYPRKPRIAKRMKQGVHLAVYGSKSVTCGLISCLGCLATPLVGDAVAAARGRALEASPLRVDQFWAEMHDQAKFMRQSSAQVGMYMQQVLRGKKVDEIPAVVATALAAAVRLGKQADGPSPHEQQGEQEKQQHYAWQGDSYSCEGSASSHGKKEPGQEESCGGANAVLEINMEWSGMEEKDRIKRVAAGRLALPATCAHASYLATAEQFSAVTKLTHVACVRDPETEATVYLAWLPESSTIVLAFRGTVSRSDALADLKILPRQVEFLPSLFPGATAHLGFLTHFTGLTSAVDPQRSVASALRNLTLGQVPSRVVCCGHSMGGALATLGATWAALQFPESEIRCITFGSPRVGNSRFISAFRTLVGTRIRVVHGADPIPAVPPPLPMLGNFSHFQPVVFLRRGRLELTQGWWYSRLGLAVGDHAMRRYLTAIQVVLQLPPAGEETKEGAAAREEVEAVAAAVKKAPLAWLRCALGARGM